MKHNFPSKIIFLDVDGVINIPPYTMFNKSCLNNLQLICDTTHAKIVISSSWRQSDWTRMKQSFLEHGFPESLWSHVIDITVRGYTYTKPGSNLPIVRGNEIKQWVDTHLKYPWHTDKSLTKQYQILNEDGSFKIMNSNSLNIDYNYVILDDDDDMLFEQRHNFVHTNGYTGLTQDDASLAIAILNARFS